MGSGENGWEEKNSPQGSLSGRSLRWMSSTKATYLLQQENKINDEWLSSAVQHSVDA